MTRQLLLVGGSAGSGKSTVARSLASQLGAGWLQLDTVWVALKAAAGPGTPAYDELAVDQRMADENDSDEAILAALVAAAETVCRVLPEVFAFELATHAVLVVDRAWLAAEARRHGFPVLDPLPFETLDARVGYALGVTGIVPWAIRSSHAAASPSA